MDRPIWVRLAAVLERNPESTTVTLNRASAEEMLHEIKRLRAGGCARDQGLTQYCAEAAAKDAENTALKAEVERLRAAQEWRFLKDAPIDDTLVLWLLRNGEVTIGPSKLGDLTVRERAEIYTKTGEWPRMSEYQPARWMPIPAPPAHQRADVHEPDAPAQAVCAAGGDVQDRRVPMTTHTHDPALVEAVAIAISGAPFSTARSRQKAIAALDAARPAIRREALEEAVTEVEGEGMAYAGVREGAILARVAAAIRALMEKP